VYRTRNQESVDDNHEADQGGCCCPQYIDADKRLRNRKRGQDNAATPCTRALSEAPLEQAKIDNISEIPAGTESTPPGSDEPIAGLPTFCRVTGTATPVQGSRIGFEVWLPAEWNTAASFDCQNPSNN
jgi:hypothetical protein